jgi:hypothetical protein
MSETSFSVALVVMSRSTSLSELTGRIGIPGSDGSHSVGEPHLLESRGVWKTTLWQLESDLPRTSALEEQFEDVYAQVPVANVRPANLPEDAKVYISIGVFSNAQIPVAIFTRRCLGIADAFGAALEVRVYVSDME